MNYRFLSALFLSLSIVTSAFAEAKKPSYDVLFPLYIETVFVSPFTKNDGDAGGPFGHSLTYLKGVCRDTSAPIPRIRMCDSELDLTTPDSGVIVSLSKTFSNVRWVANEGGRDFMLNGLGARDKALTKEIFDATVQKAIDSGAYEGIVLAPKYESEVPAGLSRKEYAKYVARMGASSDYALNFGRDAYSVKIPVNRLQMQDVVDWANTVNESYSWAPVSDQCDIFSRNLLAAAGIRTSQPFGWHPVIRWALIFKRPFPKNSAVATLEASIRPYFKSADKLDGDKRIKESLLRYGRLPSGPGALIEEYKQFSFQNELYKQDPRFAGIVADLNKKLRTPVHTDLVANLKYWQAQLANAQGKLVPTANFSASNNGKYANRRFLQMHSAYEGWVNGSAADVAAKLKLLEANE